MIVSRMAQVSDSRIVAELEKMLLTEIIHRTNVKHFEVDENELVQNVQNFIVDGSMQIFLACDNEYCVGFIGLSEACALYAHGKYGIITELFVIPEYRNKKIGKLLIEQACDIAIKKHWKRLEVTTPSLPEFQKSLDFYVANDFMITGGRKLKLDIVTT